MLSPRKQERRHILRDILITAGLLLLGALLSTLLMIVDHTGGFASMIFVLMVVLVARLTDGYVYGVAALLLQRHSRQLRLHLPLRGRGLHHRRLPADLPHHAVRVPHRQRHDQPDQAAGKTAIEAEREALRANLLRAVSHDLRTPLTSIVGSTSAILENADVLSRQQKAELLRGVRDEAQWLIRMVENLLSITRMGDPAARIDKELQAVEECWPAWRPSSSSDFPPSIWSWRRRGAPFRAHGRHSHRAGADEPAGKRRLPRALRPYPLFVELEGQMAVFTVQDDGQGISPDVLPTIFTPHLRSQTHSTDARRNMGIGLSVCLSIVKAHGGVMSAANAPEGGAVFRFTLPVEELSMEDTSHEDQGKDPHHRG